jgi:hypothetical protein
MSSKLLMSFVKSALAVVLVTGCGGPEQVPVPSQGPTPLEALAESEWCLPGQELLKSGWVQKKDGQVQALYASYCPKGMECPQASCADGCH